MYCISIRASKGGKGLLSKAVERVFGISNEKMGKVITLPRRKSYRYLLIWRGLLGAINAPNLFVAIYAKACQVATTVSGLSEIDEMP